MDASCPSSNVAVTFGAALDPIRVGERAEVHLERRAAEAVLARIGRALPHAAVAGAFERPGQRLGRQVVADAVVAPVGVDAGRKLPALPRVAGGRERREPEPLVPQKDRDHREHEHEPAKPAVRKPLRPALPPGGLCRSRGFGRRLFGHGPRSLEGGAGRVNRGRDATCLRPDSLPSNASGSRSATRLRRRER